MNCLPSPTSRCQNGCANAERPEPDLPANLSRTVENTSIVDAVGTDKESDAVRLSIFDHLPWDTEHLCLLQEKIKVYLGFIESGEIYGSYPNAKGRAFVIDVFMKFRPITQATRVPNQAEAVVATDGVSLRQAPSTGGCADDSA